MGSYNGLKVNAYNMLLKTGGSMGLIIILLIVPSLLTYSLLPSRPLNITASCVSSMSSEEIEKNWKKSY